MNDDLNSGLNGNMRDFVADEEGDGKGTHPLGTLGTWMLHGVALALAGYSAYHGIHATSAYRAAEGLGNVSGIVGITVNELTTIGTYLAYFHGQITGKVQQYIAATTIGFGVLIMALGIVGDSQMQAGLQISPWLQTYLMWILPVSPVIMAVLAGLILATDPRVLRNIKAALNRNKAAEDRHNARMSAENAKLTVAKSAANLQLNSLQMTAQYAHAAYRAPEVQRAIQAAALANLPELLRGAGIMLPYGTVIEGQTVAPLPVAPTPEAEDAAPRPSILDRLMGRQPAPAPTVVNSTHDTPATTLAPNDAGRGEFSDAELREAAELLRRTRASAPNGNGSEAAPRP